MRFVVGSDDCELPLADRQDQFSCTYKNLTHLGIKKDYAYDSVFHIYFLGLGTLTHTLYKKNSILVENLKVILVKMPVGCKILGD